MINAPVYVSERNGKLELSQSGCDFGPKQPTLVDHSDHFALVRYHGGTGWAGRGHQAYHPTRYELLLIEWSVDRTSFQVSKTVLVRKPGKLWRQAVTELQAEMRKLEAVNYPARVKRQQDTETKTERKREEAAAELRRQEKAANLAVLTELRQLVAEVGGERVDLYRADVETMKAVIDITLLRRVLDLAKRGL